MPYFAEAHLRRSLEHLTQAGHSLLISFLAMWRKGVPTSDLDSEAVRFGARDELKLLEDYLKPGRESEKPYFMPFGRPGTTRWRNSKYPGRSLQRLRSDHPDVFRQNSANDRLWSLAQEYPAIVMGEPDKFVGVVPSNLPAIAVLFYRKKPFDSVQSATEALVEEFHLDRDGLLGSVLSTEDTLSLGDVGLISSPLSDQRVLEILSEFEPARDGSDTDDEEADAAETSRGESTSSVIAGEIASGDWDLTLDDVGDVCGLRGLEEAVLRALAALRAGKHVIFTGAPGTGKTKLAECLCRVAGFPYWTVPATDQWTTFEVIGGYFPVPDPATGRERLDFLPGHVVESLQKGKCLIVDEINRADIDKAFGELLTLLSGYPVTLPYKWRDADGSLKRIQLNVNPTIADPDSHVIVVPEWWRILGAMNDADKASLKKLSLAFVRRFAFVPLTVPAEDVFEDLLWKEVEQLSSQCPNVVGLEQLCAFLVEIFAKPDAGLAGIGAAMGPAIPLTMLSHGCEEWRLDSNRSVESVLLSTLDLFVAPQLQGRADLHERCIDALGLALRDSAKDFDRSLSVWTGYIAE